MKPLASAVNMDMGRWSSAYGAKAWAACAEPWPHITALHWHKLWVLLPGVLRELGLREDTSGVTLYPSVGVTDLTWPTRGAEEGFHLLTWSGCLHVVVSCSRHTWISPYMSLLDCIPHSTKGKLTCGDLT